MSHELASWLPALGASVAMLFLGMRMRLLAPPELTVRCGACRRLLRRGTTCPCTRVRAD